MCHSFCGLGNGFGGNLQETIDNDKKQETQSFQGIHYCVAVSAICWGREDSEAWSTAREGWIYTPSISPMAYVDPSRGEHPNDNHCVL